jgi:septation ring formation regulator EzrA
MARQDALMSLHRLATPLNEATLSARKLGEQFNETSTLLEAYDGDTDSLSQVLKAMQTELEEISEGLGEARSWAGVANAIQGSSTLPTEDQFWQVDAAWDAVPPLIERLNTLITDQVPAVYTEMDAMGIRPSPGDTISVPRRGN